MRCHEIVAIQGKETKNEFSTMSFHHKFVKNLPKRKFTESYLGMQYAQEEQNYKK